MVNLWFNIRFGYKHFQWGPDGWSWRHNDYQQRARLEDPRWRWFAVYCFFGKHLQ
jgi:hypothetical protein